MSSVLAFVSWYVIITLLGWLTFPLVYFLFPALGGSRLQPFTRRRAVDLGLRLLDLHLAWIDLKQRRRDFICAAGFDWTERMGVSQCRTSNIKHILLAENEPAPRHHR